MAQETLRLHPIERSPLRVHRVVDRRLPIRVDIVSSQSTVEVTKQGTRREQKERRGSVWVYGSKIVRTLT